MQQEVASTSLSMLNLFLIYLVSATSSSSLVQGFTGLNATIPVPSVDQQVSAFLQNPPSGIPLEEALFVLHGGANDIFFNSNVTAVQTFRAIMASHAALLAKFPNATILLMDYQDLSHIPYASTTSWLGKCELHAFSRELSSLYRQNASHTKMFNAAVFQTVVVGISELFEQWEYHPEPQECGFDLLGAYGSCLTESYGKRNESSICASPDGKVFWDEFQCV